MTVVFTQTNTAATHVSNASLLTHLGLSDATAVGDCQIEDGGSAGSTEDTITTNAASEESAYYLEAPAISASSWPTGDWQVNLNVSSSNSNVEITGVYCVRANAAFSSFSTVWSTTGLAEACTAGTHTFDKTGVSASSGNSGDVLIFVVSIQRNSGAHGNQSAGITPSLTVSTPLTASVSVSQTAVAPIAVAALGGTATASQNVAQTSTAAVAVAALSGSVSWGWEVAQTAVAPVAVAALSGTATADTAVTQTAAAAVSVAALSGSVSIVAPGDPLQIGFVPFWQWTTDGVYRRRLIRRLRPIAFAQQCAATGTSVAQTAAATVSVAALSGTATADETVAQTATPDVTVATLAGTASADEAVSQTATPDATLAALAGTVSWGWQVSQTATPDVTVAALAGTVTSGNEVAQTAPATIDVAALSGTATAGVAANPQQTSTVRYWTLAGGVHYPVLVPRVRVVSFPQSTATTDTNVAQSSPAAVVLAALSGTASADQSVSQTATPDVAVAALSGTASSGNAVAQTSPAAIAVAALSGTATGTSEGPNPPAIGYVRSLVMVRTSTFRYAAYPRLRVVTFPQSSASPDTNVSQAAPATVDIAALSGTATANQTVSQTATAQITLATLAGSVAWGEEVSQTSTATVAVAAISGAAAADNTPSQTATPDIAVAALSGTASLDIVPAQTAPATIDVAALSGSAVAGNSISQTAPAAIVVAGISGTAAQGQQVSQTAPAAITIVALSGSASLVISASQTSPATIAVATIAGTVDAPAPGGPYEQLHTRVRSHFTTYVETPNSLQVQHDNQEFTAPGDAAWCRCHILHTSTEQIAWGRRNVYRQRGKVVLDIYAPAIQGERDIRQIADQFAAGLRGKTYESVTYRGVTRKGPGRVDGGWWVASYECAFDMEFDEYRIAGTPHAAVTRESLWTTIQQRFETEVEDVLAVPVLYDDFAFAGPQNGAWVRLTIQEGAGVEVDSGRTYRTVGLATAQVFVPALSGTRTQVRAVDTIATAFRAVSLGGVAFKTPTVQSVGATQDEAWWQVNVTCPFAFHETVTT